MSGGGSKTQTQVQTQSLPKGTEAALNTSTKAATALYNGGNLFQPYTGSTVVPFDSNTRDAMNIQAARARSSMPALMDAFKGVTGIANGTGFNSTQNDAMSRMQGIASGANGITTGGLFSGIGSDADGSYSESNLAKYADGSMMGRANPAFDALLQRSQADASNAVNMGASAAGRYGSGVHQGNVAREVGTVTNQALMSRLAQDEANMFGANAALDQQRLGNLGVRMGAAQGLTGVQAQNISNQAGAAGDLFNAGQQGQTNRLTAAGMLPAAYQASLMPAQTLAGIGAQKEDLAARRMNDDLRRWNETQGQDRSAIEWLNAIATGAGSLGGTTTQTVQTPRANPFMSGLGGASAGFGMGGPTGALLGGGLGLLGGIF